MRYSISSTRSRVSREQSTSAVPPGVLQIHAGPGDVTHHAKVVAAVSPPFVLTGKVDIVYANLEALIGCEAALAERVQMSFDALERAVQSVAVAVAARVGVTLRLDELHRNLGAGGSTERCQCKHAGEYDNGRSVHEHLRANGQLSFDR